MVSEQSESTYWEYLVKVLGVRSILVSARVVEEPLKKGPLTILAEEEDLADHRDLVLRILAAWGLDPEEVQWITESSLGPGRIREVVAESHSINYLVFTSSFGDETQSFSEVIFAGSLKELARDQNLKRKLWNRIQAFKDHV